MSEATSVTEQIREVSLDDKVEKGETNLEHSEKEPEKETVQQITDGNTVESTNKDQGTEIKTDEKVEVL